MSQEHKEPNPCFRAPDAILMQILTITKKLLYHHPLLRDAKLSADLFQQTLGQILKSAIGTRWKCVLV